MSRKEREKNKKKAVHVYSAYQLPFKKLLT